jgi:N-acetyl-anhydromuramyl-L-alanine amidase AmpD
MHKQWIGCDAQNFRTGRGEFQPEGAVVHRTGASLADIDKRCGQTGTFSSVHYAVGSDGSTHQYVEEADTAFHAGVVVNPTWPQIKASQNPNFYTVGIELEGADGSPPSGAQYDAAAALLAEIAGRYKFPADADHIVLHSEIRAGCGCPGNGFDREELCQRIAAAAAQPVSAPDAREVRVLRNSNVREGAPSTKQRIVRVAPANGTEAIAGFTDQGERVEGNSYWYRTEDGNYLWAGATDTPHPLAPETLRLVPLTTSTTPVPAAPVACGIPRIDQILANSVTAPLLSSDSDVRAIGAVQDLLTGLGFAGLPTVLSTAYGVCGPKTVAALASFRQNSDLAAGDGVDHDVLTKLVAAPATDPRATSVYLSLVLGFAPTGMQRVLCLVSQMEGAGKFAALNRNTDRAGLSFGIIQWAQKPGRLAEIVAALSTADADQFNQIFGGGDADVGAALLAHCRKPSGGIDPKTGLTTNPSFDLTAEPWISRFRQAALAGRFQQVQVQLAIAAFNNSYRAIQRVAPELKSERSAGFLIDVANQFGDGGLAKLVAAARRPGMSESDLLGEIADLTVERIDDAFKTGVRARRDHFLNTPFLSGDPFVPDDAGRAAGAGT